MLGSVWAQTPGGVIAARGELPWSVPEDFAHFRATVVGHPVIVGRATWESMPAPWRAARGRRGDASIVLTRDPTWAGAGQDGAQVATSIEQAVARVAGQDAWVMGGGQVYALAMDHAAILLVSEIDVPEPVASASELTLAPRIDPELWRQDTSAELAGWRTSTTGTAWRIRRYRRRG